MNDQVYTAALENASYFRDHNNFRSEALQYGFEQLAKHCQDATPLLDRIRQEAPKYDLGPDTPGNGYRSFLALFDVCFKRCLEVCQAVSRQRTGRSFFLYTAKYIEDLNSWNEVLLSLRAFLDHLNMLLEWNETTNNRHLLIESHPNAHQFLIKAMSIRRYSFYGRHAGFPYSPSIERLFKSMLTFLATYSDYYFNTTGGRFRRIVNFFSDGTRYFLDTEYRARRIVNVSQFASIEFCKSFWFLAQLDFMKKLPQQMMPSLPVVQVISLPPEPLKIKSLGGKIINIPVPSAHGPPAPIPVRLLSSKRRPGMPGASDSDPLIPLSNFLIIHCHGGGFVAQDSESHECYLREWALALDVPILSIDYSLAPEFPFPRQIQEILYVYAWVLNNAHLLGTSAEKIIFIGDSAGATLILGTTLWASDLNLPLPIGLFLAYVPLLIRTAPSPSRMLCLLDPLLPFGFMTRCLKAYAGDIDISAISTSSEPEANEQLEGANNNTVLVEEKDATSMLASAATDYFRHACCPYLSPYLASDEAIRKLPRLRILTVELDPCLDDSVEFARRCRRLGVDVILDILPDLPHGFLNLSMLSSEAKEGSKICIARICELIEQAEPDF